MANAILTPQMVTNHLLNILKTRLSTAQARKIGDTITVRRPPHLALPRELRLLSPLELGALELLRQAAGCYTLQRDRLRKAA